MLQPRCRTSIGARRHSAIAVLAVWLYVVSGKTTTHRLSVVTTSTKQKVARAHRRDIDIGRRPLLALGLVATLVPELAQATKPSCGNIQECRAAGEMKFEELEKEKGPITSMGNGIRYRETKVGTGRAVEPDDIVDITYEVRKTNGDYVYSWGRGRPDMPKDDFGEVYRVRLGGHDVPVAVEMALEGMRAGGSRTIEMPPQFGFETSNWKPEPTNFSGRQRMERYRKLLTGSGLQPGYNAAIAMDVEVVKIRSKARGP
eukprot:CAMPEP_0117543476 /NCGR_PEP_ID=MMETSP0784-20121206/45081_1 /TAXON_ID=39447 /ORGANISM="" /LENGTH=257 /DNA_ID=CAMNT_0005340257 /DNA_START=72 /DNA_END=845 /DNA_ORIENTATION=+